MLINSQGTLTHRYRHEHLVNFATLILKRYAIDIRTYNASEIHYEITNDALSCVDE